MSDNTTNPFEDEQGTYLVLVNDENQHSLWPSFAGVPAGWRQAFGPAARHECLEHVESSWTDMRPQSLIERMSQESTT
ncbi:MbtH family protein [Nocardiopsis nanhaiensis]